MHYLIDGHNLIAKLPDISLDDPNDEMKLVLRLKSWASASRKRRVTVIFDGGLPGGKSLRFSSSVVKVIFASVGRTADALLIKRIRNVKNPPEYTLVSSDLEIVEAAKARRMPHLRSEEFAERLGSDKPPEPAHPAADEADPKISEDEVAEWLELFGPVPEPKKKPAPRRKKPADSAAHKPESKAKRRKNLSTNKHLDEKLDADEVDEWLRMFKINKG